MYVKKKEREKINLIKEGETNQLKPLSFSFFLRYNAYLFLAVYRENVY